jgi:hypothetical protein
MSNNRHGNALTSGATTTAEGRNYLAHDRFAHRDTSTRFGTALALAIIMRRAAEVTKMKTAKFIFAVLVLIGNTVATYTLASATGIPGLVSEDGFVPPSYCPMQISASTPESLLGEQPVPNRPNSGELIDYYGPCGEILLGQDQPDTQRLDQYESNYPR